MARTGYKITIYEDINPSSPTYGQNREERVLDETNCPSTAPAQWVEDTRYCEMNGSGMQTGYEIVVYRDVQPLSPTYNQTREERALNTTVCEVDDANPNWQNIGEAYCRQIPYMPGGRLANDGYLIQQQQDMNEYSPTADQIRDLETLDTTHCPLPNTNPSWQTISENCHMVNMQGHLEYDGTKDIVKQDTNIYSPTYNTIQTENVEDFTTCPAFIFQNLSEYTYNIAWNENPFSIQILSYYRDNVNDQTYDFSKVTESDGNWLTIGHSSVSDLTHEYSMFLSFSQNNTGVQRTGYVKFVQNQSGKKITITIRQAAKPISE